VKATIQEMFTPRPVGATELPRNAPARDYVERVAAADAPTLLGNSPEIHALLRHIGKIAASDAPVLIQGETGSGKELAARTLHEWSERHRGPFVAINCGAIADSLIEAELFGHAKGAFTDAKEARPGVIAQAHRGTLFLDETDMLSPKGQVTLLRFLQDHRYRPVGVAAELTADVRIVAASNRTLPEMVERGLFRQDLFYRLNILEVIVPPLRERPGDIELLCQHFIRLFSAKYRVRPKRLQAEALAWLRQQPWPGNVRELENWIHRELLLCEGDEISGAQTRDAPLPWDRAI
jgi:DNA-binding NtrC family response regulator